MSSNDKAHGTLQKACTFLTARCGQVIPPLVIAVSLCGCHSIGGRASSDRARKRSSEPPIRHVIQVFDQRPWLNLDTAGDRDYEGIAFRVFLDPGSGRGALRDGTFHVEMYRIRKDPSGKSARELASDWHYSTRDVPTIAQPGMLGQGYFLHLRWATKQIAGHEVEVVTRFEDTEGRVARSGTKRLRVPKYDS